MSLKDYIKKRPKILRLARFVKVFVNGKKSNVPVSSYVDWITNKEPGLWDSLDSDSKTPLISVIVPAFNTPDKYLVPLIDSLKNQSYPNWQLCISDASTNMDRRDAISKIAKSDKRIKYHYKKRLHISDNTNEGLKLATGDFVGFLDHDDMLSPHALEEIAIQINKHADVDVIYSDED